MSAKTSPSSSRDASVGGAANVAGPVQIKKELPSDEIKEFAHSTMNELLGWYGFDGVDVDRLDLTAKTSRLLQSAAAAAAASQQHQLQQQQQQDQEQQQQQQQLLERRRTGLLRSSRTSLAAAYHSNNNNNNHNNNHSSSSSNGNAVGRKVGGMQNSNRTTTATPSDHDTRSSREDDSKSPNSIGKPVTTAGLAVPPTEEKIDYNNCCWCHRPIAENAPDYLTSSDGPRYCSESCFTQSRRACFKKAKTCDWCKHVRHAVSYVDFQDGASQLQFCSEKCLNQYKMQIFCNETQAHLDMNPHLRDQAMEAGSEAGLITPDLWLRNCRSRSASPASTVSVSPGPPAAPERSTAATPNAKRSSPSVTPPSNPSKPLISVAPVSKLLAQKSPAPAAAAPPPPPPPLQRHQHNSNSSLGSGRDAGLKHGRRKRPLRGPGSCSSGSETVASMLQKQQQQQQPPTLSADFSGSSVPLPPLSPMPEPHHPQQQQQQQQPPPVVPQQVLGRGPTAIPPSYFATPPNGHPMGLPFGRHPAPPPHHFMPPPHGMMPRGFPPPFGLPMPQAQLPEHLGAFGAMLGAVPPVTVMVPYPIIIPLPIPIPVPLPVMDFYKAHLTPEQRKRFDEERATTSRRSKEEQPQPLDCSKSRSDQELELEQRQDPAPEEEQKATMPTPQLKEEQLEEEEDEKEKDEDVQVDDDDNDDDDNDDDGKKSIPKTNSAGRASPASASPSSPASSSPATDANSSQETHCIVRDETQSEGNQDSQKLPKLKITRLQSKRTLNQTKEEPNAASAAAHVPAAATPAGGSSNSSSAASECSRPLRKRKRIIDCDFQKMALRELEPSDGHNQPQDEDGECNNINNSNSQGSGNAKAKK
ncbi:sine oculis-binding protein homolog [Drosophila madeirensis]|uniref:Sine oculis-binding protein homolog n=1 Tax=Drosophila madeirensis TaxID=30013 RepID=A0AAU9G8N0_DROMD